jgi:mannose-6-phosphate isomerase-like protein (cupin superfamily)
MRLCLAPAGTIAAPSASTLVRVPIKPGEEIGEEVHKDRDQFFRIEEGEGEIVIDGNTTE